MPEVGTVGHSLTLRYYRLIWGNKVWRNLGSCCLWFLAISCGFRNLCMGTVRRAATLRGAFLFQKQKQTKHLLNTEGKHLHEIAQKCHLCMTQSGVFYCLELREKSLQNASQRRSWRQRGKREMERASWATPLQGVLNQTVFAYFLKVMQFICQEILCGKATCWICKSVAALSLSNDNHTTTEFDPRFQEKAKKNIFCRAQHILHLPWRTQGCVCGAFPWLCSTLRSFFWWKRVRSIWDKKKRVGVDIWFSSSAPVQNIQDPRLIRCITLTEDSIHMQKKLENWMEPNLSLRRNTQMLNNDPWFIFAFQLKINWMTEVYEEIRFRELPVLNEDIMDAMDQFPSTTLSEV